MLLEGIENGGTELGMSWVRERDWGMDNSYLIMDKADREIASRDNGLGLEMVG